MNQFTKKLESQMVTYQSLLNIPTIENGEKFIIVDKNKIPNDYLSYRSDMRMLLKKSIIVRESVYKKLLQIQDTLTRDTPYFSLFITYGYRSLEIQTKSFVKQLREINTYFNNPQDLYGEVHRYVAVPIVAGHPTGGAIDLVIINKRTGKTLNFGSKQYDYSTKDCYVFSPNISRNAKTNRMLLRKYMLKAGFAPFDGEWWHFSYGDREWAYYYKKMAAIYNQVGYKNLKDFMI